MPMESFNKWDLKKIIQEIIKEFPSIKKIYLFGSRAYKTNSSRSDIDLLFFSEIPLPNSRITEWINRVYPPVDFFKSTDMKVAESAINGSAIISLEIPLNEKLDAIELWNLNDGFSTSFEDWIQETRKGIRFETSILPLPTNPYECVSIYEKILSENNLPNSTLGLDWKQIGENLSKKIEIALTIPSKWKRGSSLKVINIDNEYDFQNLVEIVIKPWLPNLGREETVAHYDGQEKKIDFSINWNSILIEAKYIKDANTEAKALKEIEGVKKFYKSNTRVNLLLFWTFVKDGYSMDTHKIEIDFSDINNAPIIITKIFTIRSSR